MCTVKLNPGVSTVTHCLFNPGKPKTVNKAMYTTSASSLTLAHPHFLVDFHKSLYSSKTSAITKQGQSFLLGGGRNVINLTPLSRTNSGFSFEWPKSCTNSLRGLRSICFFSAEDKFKGDSQDRADGSNWPVLQRWEVPWEWQTVSLISLACGLSFVLSGLVETIAMPYLGLRMEALSLEEKSVILFVDQSITTAAVLGVLFGVVNTYKPLPEDFFKYDWREPFNLQKGWLLWAGIGLTGALIGIALIGVAVSFFMGETPERETDSLVRLLPLIGSSNISTASLLAVTGVLAPLLEETVFRGFFMASMTKWVPTPIAIVISASVFAVSHLTPGEFPQLFVLGSVLGLSYAQTHNLLTPITLHAFWNSGVILLLTYLQLQGYDIKELLQAT